MGVAQKAHSNRRQCIIKLATSAKISGIDIRHEIFLSNHPPHASLGRISTEKRYCYQN
nr:hypothetical protein [Bacteroidota bacterium]